MTLDLVRGSPLRSCSRKAGKPPVISENGISAWTAAPGPEKYTEALYNLRSDIGETKNLASSAPEKQNALRHLLEEWELEMNKTAAPLDNK